VYQNQKERKITSQGFLEFYCCFYMLLFGKFLIEVSTFARETMPYFFMQMLAWAIGHANNSPIFIW